LSVVRIIAFGEALETFGYAVGREQLDAAR
jgi:hypothetical protein